MASYPFYRKNIPCELCNCIASYVKCATCDVHLCEICVEKHIGDEYMKHDIVLLKFSECNKHQRKENTHVCYDCHMPMCFSCVLSEQHKGHHIAHARYNSTLMLSELDQRPFSFMAPNEPYQRTTSRDFSTAFGDTSDRKKKKEQLTWSEPIKSDSLRELLRSLKVDFPDDPLSDSFAYVILGNHLFKLVTEIKLLSNSIVLSKSIDRTNTEFVFVFEVKVVCKEDQLDILSEVTV